MFAAPYSFVAYTEPVANGKLTGSRICIDPGHPSENGIGAAVSGATEVGIAWRVALRLRDLIRVCGGIVILTKSREREYVTNQRRAEIANRAHADLMVRLHCDDAPGATEITTYCPDREGTAPDGFRGPVLAVRAASRHAAQPFHAALVRSLADVLADRGCLTDRQTAIGARQGALTGSIRSEVPVVLVEMCVLSSAHDRAFITRPDGEERLARALLAGVIAALRG